MLPGDLRICEKTDGVTIDCRITPRSGRNTIKGCREGTLLVAIDAPPIDGRANAALVEFFSEFLGIPKSRIEIKSGLRGRQKRISIYGIDKKALCEALTSALEKISSK